MNEQAFKERTKRFALDIIRLVESLPHGRTSEIIGRQLLRSGTSVGANYRSACRGRSTADMIAKLRIVEEEGDEAMYWMELLLESGIAKPADIDGHMKEANEIVAMVVSSIKTMQRKSGAEVMPERIENPKSKI